METTQTNLPATTVRANVNERAFFKSMRHLFASSFSVMGERVKNARRAHSTKIAIICGSATRVITISDNGMGIDKFDVLLDLATSGWESTETQLSERPFGMASSVRAAQPTALSSCPSATLGKSPWCVCTSTAPHVLQTRSSTAGRTDALAVDEDMLRRICGVAVSAE